jgi:hypothetical protein
MKALIVLLLGTLSIHANAETQCKLRTPVTVIKWTGVCTDGYANDVGELEYQFETKPGIVNTIFTYGKVHQGVPTGLHLSRHRTSQSTGFSVYFTDGWVELINVLVASTPSNQHLPLSERPWVDQTSKLPDPSITYQEALNKIILFIAQKNEPSIEFEQYRAYLEGK